jgi:hypothetical protein
MLDPSNTIGKKNKRVDKASSSTTSKKQKASFSDATVFACQPTPALGEAI